MFSKKSKIDSINTFSIPKENIEAPIIKNNKPLSLMPRNEKLILSHKVQTDIITTVKNNHLFNNTISNSEARKKVEKDGSFEDMPIYYNEINNSSILSSSLKDTDLSCSRHYLDQVSPHTIYDRSKTATIIPDTIFQSKDFDKNFSNSIASFYSNDQLKKNIPESDSTYLKNHEVNLLEYANISDIQKKNNFLQYNISCLLKKNKILKLHIKSQLDLINNLEKLNNSLLNGSSKLLKNKIELINENNTYKSKNCILKQKILKSTRQNELFSYVNAAIKVSLAHKPHPFFSEDKKHSQINTKQSQNSYNPELKISSQHLDNNKSKNTINEFIKDFTYNSISPVSSRNDNYNNFTKNVESNERKSTFDLDIFKSREKCSGCMYYCNTIVNLLIDNDFYRKDNSIFESKIISITEDYNKLVDVFLKNKNSPKII
ncbi:hypothetical protein BB561_006602 [Smittium simulii]|uniref:Uncharacterized protein n=1 Tax=Smittium simulii TaxID=133385 RepID=A0A2T9Y2W7_9FUNG|nr:hypothetical protein BB561_006602 [Smittium simulii]